MSGSYATQHPSVIEPVAKRACDIRKNTVNAPNSCSAALSLLSLVCKFLVRGLYGVDAYMLVNYAFFTTFDI